MQPFRKADIPKIEMSESSLANHAVKSSDSSKASFRLPPPVFSPTADRHIAAMVAVATELSAHDNKRSFILDA
jgi:hypothetical protein